MRTLILSVGVCALSGCASLGLSGEALESSESRRAAHLAGLLEETARAHPERIARAGAEMDALEQALLDPDRAEPAESAAPREEMEPPASPAPPAPPPADLRDARSMFLGVHLASYRRAEHLGPGWRAMLAAHPDLGAFSPRYEAVDLGERGVFLRLKAGPFDTGEAARAVCEALRAAGSWCDVTDFTGESLPGEDA